MRRRLEDKLLLSRGLQVTPEVGDPGFNNGIARGLGILRAFSVDCAILGNADIAEATGIPKPTVSRMTSTLARLGYLHYLPHTGKYQLAAGVVGLAYPFLADMQVPAAARQLMRQLSERTNTRVGLGIKEGMRVLYLELAASGSGAIQLRNADRQVPVLGSAIGRACIAGLESAARTAMYEELSQQCGPEWPLIRNDLDDAVRQVESRGYCVAPAVSPKSGQSVAVPFVEDTGCAMLAFDARVIQPSRTAADQQGKLLLELTSQVRRELLAHPFQVSVAP